MKKEHVPEFLRLVRNCTETSLDVIGDMRALVLFVCPLAPDIVRTVTEHEQLQSKLKTITVPFPNLAEFDEQKRRIEQLEQNQNRLLGFIRGNSSSSEYKRIEAMVLAEDSKKETPTNG